MTSDLLLDMQKVHDYLVCIDSDGCLLDNMELKHIAANIWSVSYRRFSPCCWIRRRGKKAKQKDKE